MLFVNVENAYLCGDLKGIHCGKKMDGSSSDLCPVADFWY